AFAVERQAQAALGMALLFLWMKSWQAIFAGLLHDQLTGRESRRWSLSRYLRTFCLQAMVQPPGLFLLPIAFALTLPFGWAFAFYQNATLFSDAEEASLGRVCQRASQQAQLWPGQNHTVLAFLGAFGLFVWLNIVIVLFQGPHLLHTLLGIETTFGQSGWS